MDETATSPALAVLAKGAGGCAAKVGPTDLSALMARLSFGGHPSLLVGPQHGADAGVYQLSPGLAMVQSADFFPPMITDARAGRVAATNAMSDIYAMGGSPVTALNLLAVPRGYDDAAVAAILDGAREAVEEAGAVVAGGHSIFNDTLLFGLSVTGVVHPSRMLRNTSAEAGDVLVLTKPLGTGLVIHAYNAGQASDAELAHCVSLMSTLNRRAGEALFDCGAHASTDITGFGLLVHALDMVALGRIGFEIDSTAVPLLPRAVELAAAGMICGGTQRNASHTVALIDFGNVDQAMQMVLNDAQTSGGLLVALPRERAADFIARLEESNVGAAVIGEVVAEYPGSVRLR